jgi:glutamate racemase
MKVGVFDSGIGGLTVVKSLVEHHLFEEIIYFGDTARVPYGSKDKNTIIRYAIEAVEFFKNFDLDLIIVACNTVSAYALNEMKESASCPVVGVVEAGILATSNALHNKDKSVLILGTKATITSQAYEQGLKKRGYHNLTPLATPLFVPLVEEDVKGEVLQAILKYYFHTLNTPDAVILGCTHFPLIANEIQTFFTPQTQLIHSGNAIVEYLEKELHVSTHTPQTQLQFFASENPDALKKIAHKWLNL